VELRHGDGEWIWASCPMEDQEVKVDQVGTQKEVCHKVISMNGIDCHSLTRRDDETDVYK
jgi:hypothetical protein